MTRISNPYAIFGKTFVLGGEAENDKPGLRGVPDAVFVIENPAADSPIARLEHNTRTGMVTFFDRAGKIVGEKLLTDAERAWLTQDPKAEKYYPVSPYAYANNNPIRYVDPNGMDVYRYNDKTGEMILAKRTDDNFDQIGKFQYYKKTDTYTLKTNSKGEARTRMDNIEKGILNDGMNFMNNANVWETGGAGQPTVEGFQNFAIGFGEMIGKEVAGTYYSNIGQNNINYIHMGRHQNNTSTRSYSTPGIYNVRPDLHGIVQPHTAWHTHPTYGHSETARTSASIPDLEFKANALRAHTSQRPSYFLILTRGFAPIYY